MAGTVFVYMHTDTHRDRVVKNPLWTPAVLFLCFPKVTVEPFGFICWPFFEAFLDDFSVYLSRVRFLQYWSPKAFKTRSQGHFQESFFVLFGVVVDILLTLLFHARMSSKESNSNADRTMGNTDQIDSEALGPV